MKSQSASFDRDALTNLGSYLPDEVMDVVDRGSESGVTYDDLYARWERQNWQTEELDFSTDSDDWKQRLTDAQRAELLWFFAQFFHGEERVAVELAPFIDAAPGTEQQIFLTTQIVDEARHARFFDKFYRQALGLTEPTIEARLAAVRGLLGEGFSELFGPLLTGVADRMRKGDHSLETFVRGIVTYHLVIEATVALTGQRHVLQFLRDKDLLPAFRNGFTAVARDESRHVTFGMKTLKDAIATDPRMIEVIHDQLARTIPAAVRIFNPPGEQPPGKLLGFTIAELITYGFKAMSKRLRAVGVPAPYSWRETVGAWS